MLAAVRMDTISSLPEVLTTAELSKLTRLSRLTTTRILKNNPGFSFRAANSFRVPRENVIRWLQGETPEQIAESVRRSNPLSAA